MSAPVIINAAGEKQEVKLAATLYKQAKDARVSVPQLLSQQYPTDEVKYGSPFKQLMASCGIYMKEDRKQGIHATTIGAILGGDSMSVATGAGTADAFPASRILFPAVVLEAVEDRLWNNRQGDIALFDAMISEKLTISNTRFEYPVIDYTTRPSQARANRSSQLAEPNTMMTLTVSERQGLVPSFALGFIFSDQAGNQAADYVVKAITRQAEVEADLQLVEDVNAMINGDEDEGFAALPVTKVTVYDPSISQNLVITHKAWMKWLHTNRRKRVINAAMMNMDTYLLLERRPGRPVVADNKADPNVLVANDISPINLSIGDVRVFLLDEIPTGTIVGVDTRYAMRKITNSEAEYRAAEELVMKRASQMRWDWGFKIHRLWDQAWDVLTLAV
jgi:hypothetical protein